MMKDKDTREASSNKVSARKSLENNMIRIVVSVFPHEQLLTKEPSRWTNTTATPIIFLVTTDVTGTRAS